MVHWAQSIYYLGTWTLKVIYSEPLSWASARSKPELAGDWVAGMTIVLMLSATFLQKELMARLWGVGLGVKP